MAEPLIPSGIWATIRQFLGLRLAGTITLHVAPGGLIRKAEFHATETRRVTPPLEYTPRAQLQGD